MFFIFCGLDGTLADNRPRSHLLPMIGSESTQEWKPFHEACRTDLPVPFIMDIALALSCIPAVRFAYLTARPESVRAMTTHWLNQSGAPLLNVPLLMRDDLDTRPAHLFKAEMISRQLSTISDDPLNVEFALIEDSPEICSYIKGVFPRVRILKPQSFCSTVLRRADLAGEFIFPALPSFADLLIDKIVANQAEPPSEEFVA